ncbi:hypothetical protein LXJ59_26655, partial [Escherichia coli]|nr:hypothetical protein [Escherichia coli]
DRFVVRFVDVRVPDVLLHDKDTLLGRVITDFLDPSLRSDLVRLLDLVFGDGDLRDIQLRWHRPEGVPLVTETTLSLYTDADIRRVVMACWRPPLDTPVAINWRRAQMLLGALRKGRVGFGDQIIGSASAEML